MSHEIVLKEAGIDLAPYETRSHWRRFETDEILVDLEDVSSDVYFLVSGEVRILIRTQAGKEVILAEMRGGQISASLRHRRGQAFRQRHGADPWRSLRHARGRLREMVFASRRTATG